MNSKLAMALLLTLFFTGACKKKKYDSGDNGTGNNTGACDPTTTQLGSYFAFSGNFKDSGSNSATASNYYTAFNADKNGISNSAAIFNGSSSYLAVSGAFDKQQRSVSFWLKTTTYPGGSNIGINDAGTVMALDNPNLNYGFMLVSTERINNINFLRFVMGHSTKTTSINMDGFGNPNGWHHVVMVQSQNEVKFYIDAKLQYTGSLSGYMSSANGDNTLNIGCGRTPNGRFYNGSIDQWRFYNKALSECEVKYLYENY